MTLLKKHAELVRYLKFGTEISTEVKGTIENGNKLFSLFNQIGYAIRPAKESFKKALEIIK